MLDRFITSAIVVAVTLQVTIGAIFFGALTAVTLMAFSIIPSPY